MAIEVEADAAPLTPHELAVLGLLMQGVTCERDLASRLLVSRHTVAYHLRHIRWKFQVQTKAQIVGYAAAHGLAMNGGWHPTSPEDFCG